MTYECSTVYCDIDECSILLRKDRVKAARKEHRCTECRRVIAKGESYLLEVILWDGRLDAYKTCQDCESIRDNFFKGGWYYSEIRSMLREHVYESGGDVSEACLCSLTPKAREAVCDYMEEVWDEYYDEE